MKSRIRRVLAFLSEVMLMLSAAAAAALEDVAGSADHPALGRIPGAVIVHYTHEDYDVLVYPAEGRRHRIARVAEEEGELWRIEYLLPEKTGLAGALKRYEKRLEDAGFETLYRCRRQGVLWYSNYVDATGDAWVSGNPPRDIHCAVLRGTLDGRATTVAAYAYLRLYFARELQGARKPDFYPTLRLYVVQQAPLATELEVVTADEMAAEIGEKGHVALQGILFDFDSAAIRPESEPALAEIARFLEANPDLSAYVVGHTDNRGSYEYNLRLSQQRAEAVVEALVARFGIARERLRPVGIGPVAPVASNASEEGRARNRRVELVAR